MKRRILEAFKIPVDNRPVYKPDLFRTYSRDIENGIRDNQLLALLGERGAGKTTLFRDAIQRMSWDTDKAPLVVHVRNKDREKLRIGHIMSAVIYDISAESPRRDMEARSRQFIRLIGERLFRDGKQVGRLCIVIENSHRLHGNTIMAIKDLREDEFCGVSPLFAVILLGHDALKGKLQGKSEVFWRTETIELNEQHGWFLFQERVAFLRCVYGDAITQGARKRIATLYKVPLSLQYFVETKMSEAYAAGKRVLDEECFQLTPQELYEAMNEGLSVRDPEYTSYEKVAREAGLSKTKVAEVMSGRDSRKADPVRKALERLSEKRLDEEGREERKVA